MRRLLLFLLCLSSSLLGLNIEDPATAELELKALVAEWELELAEAPSDDATQALGRSLQALGLIQRQVGKAHEAETNLLRACELLREDPSLPNAREVLALTLQDLGRLGEAESILREVLVFRRTQPAAPLALSATLDHLGLNLLQQGRYPEVESLFAEALELIPESSPLRRAQLLGHLGRLRHTLGSHSQAIDYFNSALALSISNSELTLSLRSQRALALLRLGHTEDGTKETEAVANLAREHFAESLQALPYLNNLGALALSQGEPEMAKKAFVEALEIASIKLGPDHPGLITPLNNLGVSQQQLGDYDDANKSLQQALTLQRELIDGSNHLRLAEILRNLARNALLTDQMDQIEQVKAATRSGLEILDRLVKHGSERDRLNFLERFDLVSLPCITEDAEFISNTLLASKSRLLDALLGDTSDTTIPNWQTIQASLPANSAFVDTCRFRPLNPEQGLQYGAILILPEGPPQWVQLGSEKDLLDWLSAMRKRLAWQASEISGQNHTNAPALKLQSILKGLEIQFWQPFAEKLPAGIQEVAFSPDGALHFIPLAALLNADGVPLSHRFRQVCSVASGRALSSQSDQTSLSSAPWTVMTISEFPTSSQPSDHQALHQLLSELTPMPGTTEEAEKLRKIAPEGSVFFHDEEVTETTMLQLSSSHSVLHLGCHAFYVGPERITSDVALDFDESADLLRSSGLVLYHGAQWAADRPSDQDDLLFPDEIARLNLKGTRLVTLSSCDSGAGTPVGGEGILGLHRAFAQAGAEEVAVALWPVSDRSTPRFMERFYQMASHSDRTAQALWQTQAEFIPMANHQDFEAAVLRYAPFNLSQNGPLLVGPKIELAPLKTSPRWPLIALGVGLLLVVRPVVRKLLTHCQTC